MNQDIPKEFTESRPVEETLSLLGFRKNHLGNLEQEWGELKLSASQLFTDWVIMGNYATKRTIGNPMFKVSNEADPIRLFAEFYKMWIDAFPKEALPTEELSLGKEYLEQKRNVQKLLPPKPTIWAEREFFRFCISFIAKHHDWSTEDYEVEFSFQDGQLKLVVNSSPIFCPARGSWTGSAVVSGKQLFRLLPKRFLNDTVALGMEHDKLRVESQMIPAQWKKTG